MTRLIGLTILALVALVAPLSAQTLVDQLKEMPLNEMVELINKEGDASRGAVFCWVWLPGISRASDGASWSGPGSASTSSSAPLERPPEHVRG